MAHEVSLNDIEMDTGAGSVQESSADPKPTHRSLMEKYDSASVEKGSISKRPRSEYPRCQICGDVAANFSCGAFVCEACKKFFIRATKGDKSYVCTRGGLCEIGKRERARCPACRYQKCTDIGMLPRGQNLIDITRVSLLKCKICERTASGYHYGTLSCEGCRIFYGRLSKSQKFEDLVCVEGNTCNASNGKILTCRACRFKRCEEYGMSPDAKRVGRQPNSVKHKRFLENPCSSTSHFKIPAISLKIQNHSQTEAEDQRVSADKEMVRVKQKELNLSDFACIPELRDFEETSAQVYKAEESKEGSCGEVSSSTACCYADSTCLPQCHGDHLSCAKHLQLLKNEYMVFQADLYKVDELLKRIDERLRKEDVLELLLTNFRAMLNSQVKFLKKLAGFNELSMEDRITITKHSLFKNLLLMSAYTYDLDTSSYTFFMFKSDSKAADWLLETCPELSVSKKHFARCGRLIKQLNLEAEEYCLLTALNSFNPVVCSQIRDQSSFLSIHDRYMTLLGCYLKGRNRNSLERFAELLSILQACSEGRDEHALGAKHLIMNQIQYYLQNQGDMASLGEMFKEIYFTD